MPPPVEHLRTSMAELTLQEREAQEAIDRILAHFGQEPDASSPADGAQGEQRDDAPQGPSNFGGVVSSTAMAGLEQELGQDRDIGVGGFATTGNGLGEASFGDHDDNAMDFFEHDSNAAHGFSSDDLAAMDPARAAMISGEDEDYDGDGDDDGVAFPGMNGVSSGGLPQGLGLGGHGGFVPPHYNQSILPLTSQGMFGMPNNNGFPVGGMPTMPSFAPGFPFSGFNSMLAPQAPFGSRFGYPFGGAGQFGQTDVTAPRDPPNPRATRYVVLDSQKRVLPLAGNNIQHAPGVELSGCKDYLIHKPNGDLLVLPPGCTVVQVEGDCSELQGTLKGVPKEPKDLSTTRCTNCKEYGHRMHDCPKPFNGGPRASGANCQQIGQTKVHYNKPQIPEAFGYSLGRPRGVNGGDAQGAHAPPPPVSSSAAVGQPGQSRTLGAANQVAVPSAPKAHATGNQRSMMETNALLEAEVKKKGLDVLKSHGGHAGNYTYVLTIRGCVGMLSDGTERRTSRSFSGRGVTSTEAGRAAVMNALAGVKRYWPLNARSIQLPDDSQLGLKTSSSSAIRPRDDRSRSPDRRSRTRRYNRRPRDDFPHSSSRLRYDSDRSGRDSSRRERSSSRRDRSSSRRERSSPRRDRSSSRDYMRSERLTFSSARDPNLPNTDRYRPGDHYSGDRRAATAGGSENQTRKSVKEEEIEEKEVEKSPGNQDYDQSRKFHNLQRKMRRQRELLEPGRLSP